MRCHSPSTFMAVIYGQPGCGAIEAMITGDIKWYASGETCWQLFHQTNHIPTLLHSSYSPMYVPKRSENIFTKSLCKNTESNSYLNTSKWKQARCPSVGKYICEPCCLPVLEYCPAVKRHKLLLHE